jgi:uncharacterized protein
MLTRPLIAHLRKHFSLDWQGIHGAPHWARVRANGLRLAGITGAHQAVVELFAFLHDACLTCWDADRLDLGRIGIRPKGTKLCTSAARDPAVIEWAYQRSRPGGRS